MRTVALDLAARKISYCEVADGRVVARRTVSSLHALEDLLGPGKPPARVGIEACLEAWHVHRVLEQWKNQVVLIDTTRVRQIGVGEHGRKTDRIDAEKLALAIERGNIPTAHLLSPARQQLRMELGVRRALVETRAQYVTTVRALARAHGVQLPRCETECFATRVRQAEPESSFRELVEPLLQVLDGLEVQLTKVDQRIVQLAEQETVVARLSTMPHVGVVIASSFVSVIDDARRFDSAHKVGAYLGLVPAEKSTGDTRRLGSITKRGNSYMRALLVQASWGLMRVRNSDDPLHHWATAVAARRGKRIAVIALARRIAGILWAMWRDDIAYDPARVGRRSARSMRAHAQKLELQAATIRRAADGARATMPRASHKLTEVTS